MSDIHKSFGQVEVLTGVSFDLKPGEIHALMGENGAGKSTLMKILTGIHSKDQGEIIYKGKKTAFKSPKEAEKAGISVIHQELNIIPELTVAENFFLGKEKTAGKTGILRNKEMNEEAKAWLMELGIKLDPKKSAAECSVGQQQMIEIARAVSADSEVLIMDEPTAALTKKEIDVLFNVMNGLRKKNVAIVYISHRMEEIFSMCDRITVLRDGASVGTRVIKETNFQEVVKMMVGRELGEQFPERKVTPGKVRLTVENLTSSTGVKSASFDLKEGEILGVAGLMGAGRTELMRALFGADKSSGVIQIEGKTLNKPTPKKSIRAGMAFVTEDRKGEGLILNQTVRENLSTAQFNNISKWSLMNTKKEQASAAELIERLRIKTSGPEQEAKSLSGGNQQKIVIGKWLATNPSVLILDEPTRGVDVGAKKEIYQIMNDLTARGVSIIMVSSELPEILGMSDRILVMHEGKVTAIMNRADADQEKIMTAATGGE
ncbi:sugar ABC transporter ATP-binding protein [Jeotgalibacillus haloalkalitolerans]|uniref:Sugar ABC transporter ATP-binding protein n=1 Tax=Jeotgalibacillus haloalkalitolerans TaxID=3104292 RepID=A0ABU5KHM9_9BACL|nr:sugar ABC transporter ATP-binding protein [Jeotgalibacillus sp. HH7-29]MDZ5710757.1 sugar ABC transporter ATP-binding protein [Jeotgalibacillus sp. HH7-29]